MDHRNELAKARDEWLESEEAKKCLDGIVTGIYLKHRVVTAFIAGFEAAAQAALANAPEWIAVSERHPEGGVEVLTYPGWAAGQSGVAIDQWCESHKCFLMGIEDGKQPLYWKAIEPPAQPKEDRS